MLRPRTRTCLHCRRRRSGLSMVEVMISLAIATFLLTAAAAAFTASAQAVEQNDQFFRACQAARVALNQILVEVRRAHSVNVTGNSIDMIAYDGTIDGCDRSYVYDPSTQTLKLVTNDDVSDPDYTLCNTITDRTFSCDTATADNGTVHVVRVSVALEVQVGKNRIRLTGSAAPRRAQSFRQ